MKRHRRCRDHQEDTVLEKNKCAYLRSWMKGHGWGYKNVLTLMVPFVFGLLVYFPFYANSLVSPDGLLWIDWPETQGWFLSNGRWGMFLMDAIRPLIGSMPDTFFGGLFFYCLGGYLFVRSLGSSDRLILNILAVLCIACHPIVPSMLTYSTISFGYAFSFFLAAAAIYVTTKCRSRWLGNGLGIVLVCLSLSGTQQNISYITAGGLMFLLISWVKEPSDIKKWLLKAADIIAVCGLGAILYFLLTKVIMNVKGIQMTSMYGGDSIGLKGVLLGLPHAVINAYKNFFEFFFESTVMSNAYGLKIVHVLIFLLLVPVVVMTFKKSRTPATVLIVLGGLALMPAACCSLSLILPGTDGYSLHMTAGLGLFIPFVVMFAGNVFDDLSADLNVGKAVIGVLAVCFIWCCAQIDATDAYVLKNTKDMAVSTANRVYANVEADPAYDKQTTKLLLIGAPDLSVNVFSFYSDSNDYARWGVFWQDYSNSATAWIKLFDLYVARGVLWGLDSLPAIVETDTYKAMPVYPAQGSMQIIDGVYVVKMGNS